MKQQTRRIIGLLFAGGLLSPRGWLLRSLIVVAIFALMHLAGWRDDTRIISGTSLPAGGSNAVAMRGLLYALFYFASIILCPIFVIAAGVDAALIRLLGWRIRDSREPVNS